jgi:hypothetical protein
MLFLILIISNIVKGQITTCGEWNGDCSIYNDVDAYTLNSDLLENECVTRSEDCPYSCCYNEMGLSLGFTRTNYVETCGPYAECSNYDVGSTPCCDNFKQSTICDVRFRNAKGEGNCYRFSNMCNNNIIIENIPSWKSYSKQTYDLNGEWIRDFEQEVLSYYKEVNGKVFVLYPYRGGGILPGWTLYYKDGYIWLIQSDGVDYITNVDNWDFHGNGGNEICEGEFGGCWESTDLSNINIFCNDCDMRTDLLIPTQDCSGFYRCNNRGSWDSIGCPSGTGFNYEKQYCDWSYNFDC